jgi:hypothetical protein
MGRSEGDEQRVERVNHPLESVANHFTDHGGEDNARARVDIFYSVNGSHQRPQHRAAA